MSQPSRVRRTRRARRGAAVIETILVLPLLVLLVFGIMEFGALFFAHNNMLHAAREASRAYAVREVGAAGAEQIARDQLSTLSQTFTITVSPESSTDRERWVQISAPTRDLALGDPLRVFPASRLMNVRVSMRREN